MFFHRSLCPSSFPLFPSSPLPLLPVTKIHFKADPHQSDSKYRPENAIAPEKHTANGIGFESGVFDIVLERRGPGQ